MGSYWREILRYFLVSIFIIFPSTIFTGENIAQASKLDFELMGGKKGADAIEIIKRSPEIAIRYKKEPEILQGTLLRDKDLWLDRLNNFVYLCSFETDTVMLQEGVKGQVFDPATIPLDETFQLHSLPGASKVIYLDFDGHVTIGTLWNTVFNRGNNIVSLPYDIDGDVSTFSNDELLNIQQIWAQVAEDFAIYNIDVTTEDPGLDFLRNTGAGDEFYGNRVVISPSSSWFGPAGGVAYLSSFDWTTDTPSFVFSNHLLNGFPKYVADASSHEVGHTLGLSHDGTLGGQEYYDGHGDWAPIMGNAYNMSITQWSKGEYSGANNTEDDLALMLGVGISYRNDDHGDWIDNATVINAVDLTAVGVIEQAADVDVFSFQTGSGNITIDVDLPEVDANLDVYLQLLDSTGNPVAEDDPYYILPASLSLTVAAGSYYILLDGAGTGDPDTGYTDYGSLGQYNITMNVPAAETPPDPPSNLTAASVPFDQINLDWQDNSSDENGFAVERSPDGESNWQEIDYVNADGTRYQDTNLDGSTTYFYRVSAYNSSGSSGYSNIASATTEEQVQFTDQSAFAELAVAGYINGSYDNTADNDTVTQTITEFNTDDPFRRNRYSYLEHKWLVSVQPGSTVTLYADAWSPASIDGDNFIFSYSTDDVSYVDMFLVASVYDDNSYQTFQLPGNSTGTLYIRVKDTDRIPGNRSRDTVYVDHLFIRTEEGAGAGQLPAPPSNLSATAISGSRIDMTWQDNAIDESGYYIECSLDGQSGWFRVGTVGMNEVSFADTGLNPQTTYYYRVQAYNNQGESDYSNAASTVTLNTTETIHVAGLGGTTQVRPRYWRARVLITVHDQDNRPAAGVIVTGSWDDGANGSCLTDTSGQCFINSSGISNSVTGIIFSVTDLQFENHAYAPGDNAADSIEISR